MTVYDKAIDLVEQHRVELVASAHGPLVATARVAGDHDRYTIHATKGGLSCDCAHKQSKGYCSHILAAMIRWAEE